MNDYNTSPLMSVLARRATPGDIPLLVTLMDEFYAEGNYPLDHAWATNAFTALLANESNGAAWILTLDGAPAGHIVLTLHFSMEYGGLCGTIDDLFVRPSARRHGVARVAVEALLAHCQARGVLAVQVETGTDNTAARTLYESCGLGLRDDARLTFIRQLPHSQ